MPTVEKVEESTAKHSDNKFEGVKIALQVVGYDGARIVLPAVAIAAGVACGAGLLIWCCLELQKVPSIELPRSVAMVEPLEVKPETREIAPVQKAAPVRKNVKRVRKPRQARKTRATPYYNYDSYDYWAPDHPTGGRVVRYDSYTTDYAWNTK